MAKLSALEQAALEVETFENSLDVLLSVHKEPCEQWDWIAIAAELGPLPPTLEKQFELQARLEALANHSRDADQSQAAIMAALDADRQAFRAATEKHENDVAQTEVLRKLAERVIDGEGLAFLEAFAQFNPVAEFSSAGSLRKFAVERPDLIDCMFKVDIEAAVPTDAKTLTATGKLSVKPMPKTRRHELCQDYVSACSLRMAGEVFAMLPVQKVIVTALADVVTDSAGWISEVPILSVLFHRLGLANIDFETISPARAIEHFQYRCNFKATRGTGGFQAVTPMTVDDAVPPRNDAPGFDGLMTLVKELQDEIRPAAVAARATTQKEDTV